MLRNEASGTHRASQWPTTAQFAFGPNTAQAHKSSASRALHRSRAANASASGRHIMPATGAAQSSCPRSASNSSGAGDRRQLLGDPNGRRQSSSMPRGRGRRCCSVPTCMCLTCPPASKEPHQKRSSSRGSAESDEHDTRHARTEMTRVFSQCVTDRHGTRSCGGVSDVMWRRYVCGAGSSARVLCVNP